MCLDQGSIPCSSTLSAVALAKADFFIPAKADFLSAEGGLSFPPKANYLSAEGELSLRRKRIFFYIRKFDFNLYLPSLKLRQVKLRQVK
jgi:hypothetical protein